MTTTEIIDRRTADNVWAHWWAGHMAAVGAVSRLPLDPLPAGLFAKAPAPYARGPRLGDLTGHQERPNRKERRRQAKGKGAAAEAEWAKRLMPSDYNKEVTLNDVLVGIDDYFEIFAKLRRSDPDAYEYFSMVGAPIGTNNHYILKSEMEETHISHADLLPSWFGVFASRTKDEWRDEVINDTPTLLDFCYYGKMPKSRPVPAPLDSVVYAAHEVALDRNAFTKAELKKYPQAKGFDLWWSLAILPDGEIKAMPVNMSRRQILPGGDAVTHSGFMIPPGLYKMGKQSPHDFARLHFNAIRHFTASAIAGAQVTITRGKRRARLGIPIPYLKVFFSDRSPDEDGVKKQIFHFVGSHLRTVATGKTIRVGEHLRGNRSFSWRGHKITVSVPGIHHPAIEAFHDPGLDAEEVPEGKKVVTMGKFGEIMSRAVHSRKFVPIRRGQPTERRHEDHLRRAND